MAGICWFIYEAGRMQCGRGGSEEFIEMQVERDIGCAGEAGVLDREVRERNEIFEEVCVSVEQMFKWRKAMKK